MIISAIAAVSSNGVIGIGNELPWRLPADLARFKRLTMGHTLVMGRKTFESIKSPLFGRSVIVVTRQSNYSPTMNAVTAHSVEEALQKVSPYEDEVFIAGGADLYAQTMELWKRLYLTRVHVVVKGDSNFPEIDLSTWKLTELEERRLIDLRLTFLTYER